MPLWFKRSFLAASALAAAVSSAQAGSFSAMYVFGDSLSDVGNAYIATGGTTPASPPYSNGRFSNGNLWVQDLATHFGLPAVTPSLAGGNDYAVGGAQTGSANPGDLLAPLAQGGQIASFQATHPVADPNGLYIIWIGSNDLDGILTSNPSQAIATAAIAVSNIDTAILTLEGEGAKQFLIATVPDLGKSPAAIASGPAGAAAASSLSAFFDQTLVASLGSLGGNGVTLDVLDAYSLLDAAAANPGAFGFTNVTQPCLTGTTANPVICANPNQYLFWDSLHPTAAGQQLVANAALQVLPEPGTLTMLIFGAAGMLGLAVAKKRKSDLLN